MKPILILNPFAGGGVLRHFDRLKHELQAVSDGEMLAVVTMSEAQIHSHVLHAAGHGFDTVLAVGGDGTNRAVLNAMMEIGAQEMMLATLPLGTGRDLARSLEMPLEPAQAVAWLRDAVPTPMDIGRVQVDGAPRFFLNGSSTGISGLIAGKVNAVARKRPWTFVQKTVLTLLRFGAPRMVVEIDGHPWFEGEAFALTVGNGRYFGRGMKAHPQALLNDGLFDVVLIESMPTAEAIVCLPQLVKGTHLARTDVQFQRGSHVRVSAYGNTLDVETDGDAAQGKTFEYTILPNAIRMLAQPGAEAFRK